MEEGTPELSEYRSQEMTDASAFRLSCWFGDVQGEEFFGNVSVARKQWLDQRNRMVVRSHISSGRFACRRAQFPGQETHEQPVIGKSNTKV